MTTNGINLIVRGMAEADISKFVNYWLRYDHEFFLGMGVDLSNLPSRKELGDAMIGHIESPLVRKESYYLVWEVDGEAIGHTNVNQIEYGESASMHLHIWHKHLRAQGLGSKFVKRSVPIFFKDLKLKRLFCEPSSQNEASNRVLSRAGFEFEKTYVTKPSSSRSELELNRWSITRDKVFINVL